MGYITSSKPRQAGLSDDELFAAVLALPPARRWLHFDRLVGRREIDEIGYRVKQKRQSPEKCPARNAQIRRRHQAGETQGQLALDYGLTPSGIAKIIQRGRRKFTGR